MAKPEISRQVPEGPKVTGREKVRILVRTFIGFFVISYFIDCGVKALGHFYNNYFAAETPLQHVDADALGADDLPGIIATSRTNDLKFDSEVKGKQFAASGSFKSASKEFFSGYLVTITVEYNDVVCRTDNPETLATASRLSGGESLRIFGVIDNTFLGSLVLARCGISSGSPSQ